MATPARSQVPRGFGRRLRNRRIAANLGRPGLAKRAKLRQSTICRLENGNTNPNVKTLLVLVKALGCTSDELLFE